MIIGVVHANLVLCVFILRMKTLIKSQESTMVKRGRITSDTAHLPPVKFCRKHMQRGERWSFGLKPQNSKKKKKKVPSSADPSREKALFATRGQLLTLLIHPGYTPDSGHSAMREASQSYKREGSAGGLSRAVEKSRGI